MCFVRIEKHSHSHISTNDVPFNGKNIHLQNLDKQMEIEA